MSLVNNHFFKNSVFETDPWYVEQKLEAPETSPKRTYKALKQFHAVKPANSKTDKNAKHFVKLSDDGSSLSYTVDIPENFNPKKICITVNNFKLSIKGEDSFENDKTTTHYGFTRNTTLPELTDVNALTARLVKGKLTVCGPLACESKLVNRVIPVS